MFKIKSSFVYTWICMFMMSFPVTSYGNDEEMKVVVGEVSKMYLAAMVYIFKNQAMINAVDANKDDLFGKNFVNNIKGVYKGKFKSDFPLEDHNAKKMLVQSMIEVMEDNRALLYDKKIGFKGFIPAIFAFQLAEKLTVKGVGLKIKFTRTKEGLRNRLNSPDDWEVDIMKQYKKEPRIYYDPNGTVDGKEAYRQFTPLPMQPFCLNCHGVPVQNPLNKGKDESQWTNIDVTGFSMEGWKGSDFGGGVSISIEKNKS
jgi:hypothetical protein